MMLLSIAGKTIDGFYRDNRNIPYRVGCNTETTL